MALVATPAYVLAQSGPAELQTPTQTLNASVAPPSKWSAAPLQLSGMAAYAALQALDVASTFQALKAPGTKEANPVLAGFVDHPVAFIAVKSAATLTTLVSLHKFSKTHPKASLFVMAAVNSGYACIVASNFQKASGR